MDHDTSKHNGCKESASGCVSTVENIDAAAVFLDTLKAFDEADRLEVKAGNEEFAEAEPGSFLPSLENIMEFSSYIRGKMDFLFTMGRVANDPPFEIDLDGKRNKLIVRGERSDLKRINRLINNDMEIRDGLITLLTIADQTYQLLESLDADSPFTGFIVSGKVIYLYGDGFLSLYKEED